ncbi:hypothetical protein MNSC_02280 [Minisyncoccus archaeophilus]|uniref:prepilin-type N-terminal cleavage/methylation domain-containing protein n=1 Tax=Minisyncoccus archaeiphilus TaxID=3238481 RepID=UPI00399CE3B5
MNKKSFTLIELIIVIFIIGILAAFIIANLGGSRSLAQDAVRKNDIANLYKSIVGKQAVAGLSGYYEGSAAIKQGETPVTLEEYIRQFLKTTPYDPDPNRAYLYKGNGNDFSIAAILDDGTCFIKSTGPNLFGNETVCQQYLLGGLGMVENLMIINGTRVDLSWIIPDDIENPETAIICIESDDPITDFSNPPSDSELINEGVLIDVVVGDDKYRFDPETGNYYCKAFVYDSSIISNPGTPGSSPNTSTGGFSSPSSYVSALPSSSLGGSSGGSVPAPSTSTPYSISGSSSSGGTTSNNFTIEPVRLPDGTGSLTVVWKPGFGSTHTIIRRLDNTPPSTDSPQSLTDGVEVHNDRNIVDALTTPIPYSHIDTGLSENLIYCYSAWSYDESTSSYSTGYVLACGAIPAADPEDFTLVGNQSSIDLSWTKGHSSYRTIIRRLEGTVPPNTIDQGILISNTDTSSYSDTTAEAGKNYCYSIWSVNASTGAVSNGYLSQCGTLYRVSLPTNFTASNPTASSINLSWVKGTVGDKVVIRRSAGTAPQSLSEGVEIYRNSANSYIDNNSLNFNTSYCYSIWGYDSIKDQYSESFATACNTTTDPSSLTLLNAIDGMKGTGNGDKTATTGFAEIPVEYIEHDTSVHYTTSTNLGSDTADSRMLVVRYNGDVLIDAGATITPTTRKRGMFMYVDGALTVNGTISMTARGAANVAGDRILILTDSGTSYEIPAVGGAGGAGRYRTTGLPGVAGSNGGSGGGGGGGARNGTGGNGTAATSYSGGSAGGTSSNSAALYGGAGGNGGGDCYSGTSGAGAGNPGGTPSGGTGTGGLLVIYAKTITVSSTGKIQSNGSNGSGGTGSDCATGGGAGGGSVNLFYQNTLTNGGTISANGGSPGVNGDSGGAGGAGTVRNPQSNPYQLPVISANVPYDVNEQTAKIDVTISEDYGKGNSTILLEWGNDMVGDYTYSTTLTSKSEGTYTMTMDRLDTLPLSKTYYRITVTNNEGGSSPLIGNFQVQKSLLTGVRQLNNTGNGDKSIVTAYATIPVEYVQVDGSTHYTTSTNLGSDTADSRMLVVRYNGDVLIDAGATITPTTRKRGMFMYVDGALTVNGTISMTARGAANVPGDRILVLTDSGTSYEIPAVGGAGGAGRYRATGLPGVAGSNGGSGGGGGGGARNGTGGNGTAATSYSGGSAGGTSSNSAALYGGAGGNGGGDCYSGTSGAGAGNPGGTPSGGTGTGGLLVIYAKTITVSSTGKIQSNGSNGSGGTGSDCATGGGAGGGSVNLFYQNTLTNGGTISANGGSPGVNGDSGGAGGAGTVRNPQSNPYQLPVISANVPYDVNEQTAKIDVTISEDYGKGNSTILLEWGNDMVGDYTYSTTLTSKSEGTYTMTMDRLDTLPLSKTYYRITVTNNEGGSSPLIGNFQVQKSLLTGVRQLNNTGNGDKSIVTAYATIPVEYVQVDGDTTYSSNPVIGNTTADARMLVTRYNGNLTINSGVTLTPQARKRGMFLYVDGALTINGTISMTARGAANVPGDRILILTDSGTSYEIPAVGGAGGAGRYRTTGLPGVAGSNGGSGGGGGGGARNGTGGNGTAATSYSGGSAGGTSSNSAALYGGAGGNGGGDCYSGTSGAGAGNPGGTPSGGTGTGGLLVIYAKTITVSSTGKIQSNGSNGSGGTGSDCATGGGAGGGSVNLFYQNTLTNGGTISANGGSPGVNGDSGGAGGAGTVRMVNIVN